MKLIDKNKNKSKALWSCVDHICNKSRPETKIETLKIGNDEVSDKQVIANNFNKYFSELWEIYANKIKTLDNYETNERHVEQSMYLYPTDEYEVQIIIKLL